MVSSVAGVTKKFMACDTTCPSVIWNTLRPSLKIPTGSNETDDKLNDLKNEKIAHWDSWVTGKDEIAVSPLVSGFKTSRNPKGRSSPNFFFI